MKAAISARNISLDFHLRGPSFLDFRRNKPHRKSGSRFRAINDLSFEFIEGDKIGLIGRNGAGKSTLLKIMSGLIAPTSGEVELSGECFPLLNLSADVLLNATCLQNIRLRAYLKGLSGSEYHKYCDAVLEAANIERFLYSPVSALSTGMRTRFMLALIGETRPDLLVMDEWIGTTDRNFIDDKSSHLNQLVRSAKIFVLATHNRSLVKKFCNKVMLLDGGKIEYFGEVDEGYQHFNKILREVNN